MFGTRRWLSLATLASAVALAAAGCASSGSAAPTWTFSPTSTIAPAAVVTAAPTPTPVPTFDASQITWTPGTVAKPRVIDIRADDGLNFTPGAITVAEGETVTFNVTVTGKASHEFMVGPAADVIADKEGTPEIDPLLPGKTESVTFTFDGTGPYAFACHAPSHFEHGMMGWIIVVGPNVPTVGTQSAPRLVHIDMTDKLAFTPATVSVTAGETVRFILTNSGTATHEFAVGPFDKVKADEVDGKVVLEADEILAGMTKDLVFTFDGTGPYGYACHEPGHFEAGMLGTVVLSGG